MRRRGQQRRLRRCIRCRCHARTVALSPAFRARRAKDVPAPVPTQNEAARQAVEALQAMLDAYGWERVDGGAWYEGRFRRRP